MGKRNEPINSLFLLLRHRFKTIKEQKKRCFLLDTFRISVLKQRLLGGVLGEYWSMGESLNQPSSVQDDGPMGCKLLLYGDKVNHV